MLELPESLSRPELVDVVDDKHDGFDLHGELRKDPVHQLVGVE